MKTYFAAHVGGHVEPPSFCWVERYKGIHILCGYTSSAGKTLQQVGVMPFYYSPQKLEEGTWIKDYNVDNQLYRSPKELATYLLDHFFVTGAITNPFAVMQQLGTFGTEILYWYKRYEFEAPDENAVSLKETKRYRQYLLSVKQGLNARQPMIDTPSRFMYDPRLEGCALRPPAELPYRGQPWQIPKSRQKRLQK